MADYECRCGTKICGGKATEDLAVRRKHLMECSTVKEYFNTIKEQTESVLKRCGEEA